MNSHSATVSSPAAATKPAPDNGLSAPKVRLQSLDVLWFQVAGTVCNLACTHCFISCSPSNRTHEMMSLGIVQKSLEEGRSLGVKEVYFTGGEPFLNPDMEAILETTLAAAPATVLTNGLLLDEQRCQRLAAISEGSPYSLDFRVSLDGYDAASNDSIRGAGTFDRILKGIANLHAAGLDPVVTVTEVHRGYGSDEGKERFLDLLRSLGVDKPRLKVLPVFQMGAEAERSGAYESWQRLREADALDERWDHLQCSACRMVTSRGVWVCPILVNEPGGKMGDALTDTLGPFELAHPACWTCHAHGVSCRT